MAQPSSAAAAASLSQSKRSRLRRKRSPRDCSRAGWRATADSARNSIQVAPSSCSARDCSSNCTPATVEINSDPVSHPITILKYFDVISGPLECPVQPAASRWAVIRNPSQWQTFRPARGWSRSYFDAASQITRLFWLYRPGARPIGVYVLAAPPCGVHK
jgi:hypothetical protein